MATKWGKLKGRLEAYAEAKKNQLLIGDIQAHMMKEHAKPSTRRQDIVHPSEMAKQGWCPLGTYLRIKACREASDPFLKAPESVGVQLLNIFDEGHMIHDKWQKRLRDMGDLWGNWECTICGHKYKNFLTRGYCGFCDAKSLIYHEVPLRAGQYLISGHADGAVPRLNALIEIKSVGAGTVRIEAPEIYEKYSEGQKIDLSGLWKAIEKPFPSHIRQGQLYLALCNMIGYEFNRIIFIYEAKFNQGVKEFVVDYDPDFCKDMFQQCQSIVDALAGGELPKCPTGSSCKDCEKYGASPTMERVTTPVPEERAEANRPTIRRVSGTTRRIKRSPRPRVDGASE